MAALSIAENRASVKRPTRGGLGPQFYVFDDSWTPSRLHRIDGRNGLTVLGIRLWYRHVDFDRTLVPYFCQMPERSPRGYQVDAWRMRTGNYWPYFDW